MKLIDIKNIEENIEFWAGTEIRIYNVGMNVDKKEDFYDYMLISVKWDTDYLYVANITQNNNKAGSIMSIIKKNSLIGNNSITCLALKKSIGEKNVYIKEYS